MTTNTALPFPSKLRLGYGSSWLMSRLGRAGSLRLLECAFDSGIRHFDTARMYGYGEAEIVVGDLLAGKRDQIYLVTKGGILPPQRSTYLSAAKAVARKLVVRFPGLKPFFRKKAESLVKGGQFDIETISKSLDTSLRQLRTDYIDVFLLHECQIQDLLNPALLEFLQRAKQQGKIRDFGVASTFGVGAQVGISHPDYASVIQIPSNVWNRNVETFESPFSPRLVTHSIFGGAFQGLEDWFRRRPDQLRVWNERLNVDCSDKTALGSVFLSYSLATNPGGVTLFSSVSENKIAYNARIASQFELHASRASVLRELVATVPVS